MPAWGNCCCRTGCRWRFTATRITQAARRSAGFHLRTIRRNGWRCKRGTRWGRSCASWICRTGKRSLWRMRSAAMRYRPRGVCCRGATAACIRRWASGCMWTGITPCGITCLKGRHWQAMPTLTACASGWMPTFTSCAAIPHRTAANKTQRVKRTWPAGWPGPCGALRGGPCWPCAAAGTSGRWRRFGRKCLKAKRPASRPCPCPRCRHYRMRPTRRLARI